MTDKNDPFLNWSRPNLAKTDLEILIWPNLAIFVYRIWPDRIWPIFSFWWDGRVGPEGVGA